MKNLLRRAALLALILPAGMHAQAAAPRQSASHSAVSANREIIETRPIDVKGCVKGYSSRQFVIRDAEAFRKAVRADGSRDWCRKNLESIDFTKHSLLGITLVTDYCGSPPGLAYQLIKDATAKKYLFDISYHTTAAVCRRMGHWDVWVVVPKMPDDYEVGFQVRKIPSNGTEQ